MKRHTGRASPSMRPTRLFVLAALAAVATASRADAHDLEANVTFTATEVKVVAAYDGDEPAEGAKVTLSAADGAEVASGVLDAKGVWVTPLPPPGRYVVVVRDAGHRDRKEFTINPPPLAVADPAPAVEMTHERWRIDKTLGLAIGLGLLLGGTLVSVVLRRRRA